MEIRLSNFKEPSPAKMNLYKRLIKKLRGSTKKSKNKLMSRPTLTQCPCKLANK